MDLSLDEKVTPKLVLAKEDQTKNIQEIRLKKHMFNGVLLAYLRSVQKYTFFPKDSPFQKRILLTKALDLDFEISVMNSYHDIVQFYFKKAQKKTSLEEDIKILESMTADDPSTFRKKMCIIFRKEKKEILKSHVNLANFIISILEKAKELQKKLTHGEKIADCHIIFKQFYMAPQEGLGEFEGLILREDLKYDPKIDNSSDLDQVHPEF